MKRGPGPARSEGTHLFYLHHHHAHHTPPDAHSLTAEVVLSKAQVDEGVADEAERLWDRAVEVVGDELQVLQASEVRADAVRDGTLGSGPGQQRGVWEEAGGSGRVVGRRSRQGGGEGPYRRREGEGKGNGEWGMVKSNGSSSLTHALLCTSSGPRYCLGSKLCGSACSVAQTQPQE